jgi:hypothetical protein
VELNYIVHFWELVEQKHRYEDPEIRRNSCFTILFMFCIVILYAQIYLVMFYFYIVILYGRVTCLNYKVDLLKKIIDFAS